MVLKRICFLLALLMLCTLVPVSVGAEEITITYKAGFSGEQGIDNFYYYAYPGNDGDPEELMWTGDRWMPKDGSAYPVMKSADFNTATDVGAGYRFVAPEKGMVQLFGEVAQAYADSAKGNGIIAHIKKNKKELWSAHVTYGNIQKYNLIIPVRAGDEIHFYADSNGNNGYDWFWWRPTVSYLNMPYVPEVEDSLYLQKVGEEYTELAFNEKTERYHAEDGIAYISAEAFMTSENCTLVKRYPVETGGRYRVNGSIRPMDARNGGIVITIKKNDEIVWRQLATDDFQADFDVRMLAQKDDVIDVELDIDEYTGYNFAQWECSIGKYPNLGQVKSSTSQNFSYSVKKEIPFSSLSGRTADNGVKFYAQRFNRKVPMEYNPTNQRWESTVANDTGYFSAKQVYPCDHSDAAMEYTITEDGILRADGKFVPNGASDGVIIRMYLNDEVVWSSREGGERVVRYDEPYDVSFFRYDLNCVMKVKAGDILKFTFNPWRLNKNDNVDVSDIMLKYIDGNILSQTTKWKMNQSLILDTQSQTAYLNGQSFPVEIVMMDDTNYLKKSDAVQLCDEIADGGSVTIDGAEYLPIRKIAEGNGKNVVWALDRLVIIHDGISGFFGWQELSEMNTVLKGGRLYE